MSLKPMFERAPLLKRKYAPLDPARVTLAPQEAEKLRALCAVCIQAPMQPLLVEGALRCAVLCGDEALRDKAATYLKGQLAGQGPDGAMPQGDEDGTALMLAARTLYAMEGDKALLQRMMDFCAHLSATWGEQHDSALLARPAGVLALAQWLHALTGKKALLHLMDLIRRDSMDWSGLMTTYSVQKPMKRLVPVAELSAGVEQEDGDVGGFYTRQFYATYGPAAAEGLRVPAMMSLYSGSGRDLEAAKTGYGKIMRWHGTALGCFTSDLHVAGASPSAAISGAAAGETASSLCESFCVTGEGALADALARVRENALPTFIQGGRLTPFQRVNALSVNCGTKDCYRPGDVNATSVMTLGALMRGAADAACCAVCASEKGLCAVLTVPGTYAGKLGDKAVKLTVCTEGDRRVLRVETTAEAVGVVAVRIPGWCAAAELSVQGERVACKAGEVAEMDRVWHSGDEIVLTLPEEVRVEEGFHQSVTLVKGDTVLALPLAEDEDHAWALAGTEGETALLRHVCDWKSRVHVPAEPPIAPKTEGELERKPLIPFALTARRIAAFPKAEKA